MNHPGTWSVDRLAAANLFTILNIDATDHQIEIAATHFAEHREDAYHWSAERIRARVIDQLETSGSELFMRKPEAWGEGFRAAQEELMTLLPSELIDLPKSPPPSRGRILRSMLRQRRAE